MTTTSHPAKVTQIEVKEIQPNPHNPRRLFDEGPMEILRDSIQKLGILVPLTVYEPRSASLRAEGRYVLLDGERRWRCARELDLKAVPAIIVEEPTEQQNILTMFHIHNVREGWQLMPTALKLKTLMDLLGEANERKLAELTQLSISQIRRCKILLTYPKRFQNTMLAPQSERMKADFFIELQRIRGPALEEPFAPWRRRGDSTCIQRVLDKYNNEVIKAVTEFRRLAEVYRASAKLGKKKLFMKRFAAFLDDPDMTIDEVHVPGATFAKEAKEIRRSASRLLTQIDAIDLEWISSDDALVSLLRRLVKLLRRKLDQALLTGPRYEASDKD